LSQISPSCGTQQLIPPILQAINVIRDVRSRWMTKSKTIAS